MSQYFIISVFSTDLNKFVRVVMCVCVGGIYIKNEIFNNAATRFKTTLEFVFHFRLTVILHKNQSLSLPLVPQSHEICIIVIKKTIQSKKP